MSIWCGFCPCFLTILKLKKKIQNLNYPTLISSVVSSQWCSDNVPKCSHLSACLVEALDLHVWSGCSYAGLAPCPRSWATSLELCSVFWHLTIFGLKVKIHLPKVGNPENASEEERGDIVPEHQGSLLAPGKRTLSSLAQLGGVCFLLPWASASALWKTEALKHDDGDLLLQSASWRGWTWDCYTIATLYSCSPGALYHFGETSVARRNRMGSGTMEQQASTLRTPAPPWPVSWAHPWQHVSI